MDLQQFAADRYQQIVSSLGNPRFTRDAVATLERMSSDEVNKPALLAWLQEGAQIGDRRWEIRTALRCLAHVIQPRSYLEIGTRRGWSLAQVLAAAPNVNVYSVDMWVENYGDVENPGPEFVRAEMKRAAPDFCGNLTFLSGNSHNILPVFLDNVMPRQNGFDKFTVMRHAESRPHLFDLITVDGDHTALGAWWDLLDVMPHVAIGGAVVFDDLLDKSDEMFGDQPTSYFANRHPPLTNFKPSLKDVWLRMKRIFGNFAYIENYDGQPPIGVAVRMR